MHSAINLRRPDVLLQQKIDNPENRNIQPRDNSQSDDESTDSETPGDPTFSDEDSDRDGTSGQVARAVNGKEKTSRGRNERVMAPEECRAHLRLLFRKEAQTCSLLFGRHGPFATISPGGMCFASADMFFLQVIPVAPIRFRPPATVGETLFEHPQNELLAKVINTSYRLRDLNVELRTASEKNDAFDDTTRKKILGALLDALVQLQIDVNSFMDSSKNPAPVRHGKLPPLGVKQGLEKKEGLFRKNMMVLFFPSFLQRFE
jgi:DNA-directed RNA polymerase I subunit RPA1